DLSPTTLSVDVATSFRHLQVHYSITNKSAINVTPAWTYADLFYVSTNSVLDASATQIAVFYENQPLPAASSYSRTNPITIPSGVGQGYYLLLKADGHNQITEINENNNVLAIPLVGTLPDVTTASFNVPGAVLAGQPIQVTYTGTN